MTFLSPPCRRWALALTALFLASPALPDSNPGPAKPGPNVKKWWVYVGTYTGKGKKDSKGIYRFDLDPATGKLTPRGLAGAADQPSFLALHPNGRFLYAVGEFSDFRNKKSGAISAFAIDRKTGKLTPLNQKPSGGPGPCHLVVDARGKHVLAANYTGGSACALEIKADGRLGKPTAFKQHRGSSVNKARQEAPHAHSINLDAANHFAFVADLGLDKVMIYRYDADQGSLKANKPPSVAVAPGSGPRHFAFHPKGRRAYVINELKSTVTAFRYDPKRGELIEEQTLSTLPKGFKGESYCAEVQVHPTGKFVYGSNRGHNSIATFAVDPKTGKLTFVATQAKGIKWPRNFGIDPTGTFLIVANEHGNSLGVFRIDPKSGKLKPTGNPVKVPKPVCVKFMPAPG
jgi:6-phosphogluconolactonase